MRPLLQVCGLRIAFGAREAVAGVDLEIAPGEVLGLTGRSGSGKSLTILGVLRLPPADAMLAGGVRLREQDLERLDDRALSAVRGRDVAAVFQEPATALDPLMPIGRQVSEAARVHGRLSRRAAAALARTALDRVGLSAVPLDRRPHQLSGGQRQRVAIAAAIAIKPRLLLADEPTAALDAVSAAEVMALLLRLAREDGMALLLVSHDLPHLAHAADRIAVMDAGRIVAMGAPGAVLADPHPAVQALARAASAQPPCPPVTPGEPLLQARSLTRRHRRGERAAVAGVDLTLHAGETLGVLGESGAGKSTLLRLVLGLERPDAGEVRLAGQRFTGAARQRALIQPVFQDPYGSFDPRWSAARIVAEPLGLLRPRLGPAEQRMRVTAVLAEVGLPDDAAERLPAAFSGGQRQRIALARALVLSPRVLVLDEATSALDAATRAEVLALLAERQAARGAACLVVAHDLDVIRALADRVMVMREGEVVETGPTAEVLGAPQHPYTQRLVEAASLPRQSGVFR